MKQPKDLAPYVRWAAFIAIFAVFGTLGLAMKGGAFRGSGAEVAILITVIGLPLMIWLFVLLDSDQVRSWKLPNPLAKKDDEANSV